VQPSLEKLFESLVRGGFYRVTDGVFPLPTRAGVEQLDREIDE